MNLAQNLLARQVAALVILGAGVVSVWTAAVQPIVAVPLSRWAEVADLSGQIARLRALGESGPDLQRRRSVVLQDEAKLQVLWNGPNRTQIAAAMQDVIRSSTRQSGGQVVSASIMDEDTGEAMNELSIRTRVEGTLGTLEHVLASLDSARPRLFVNFLVVNASEAASSRDHAQRLTFELDASAYLTNGGSFAATP